MKVRMVLAAAAALLAVAAPGAPAGEGPRSVKVGVVDVDKVLREYKKSNDLAARIVEEYKAAEDLLKKKRDVILADQRKLVDGGRDADSLELVREKQAIEYRVIELRAEEKKFLADRSAAELKAMNEVWDDLTAAVARQAKDRGLDLVLKQQLRLDDARTKDAFYRNVAGCPVLFHSEQLDLTEELLKTMNADYERGGARTPEPKAPPAVPAPKGGKKN